MNNYEPSSRRPIAEVFRKTARGAVALCVRWGVHPDVVSYLSVAAAAGAALGFWRASSAPILLLIAPLLCLLRLWFNMLDGMVALASGKASYRGEIVNELPDRISDVLIFVGVAHGGLNSPFAGYWAAILALGVAYVGTLGQAVGAGRQFGGWMSKQWRMAALAAGAWATLGLIWAGAPIRFGGWTVLDWTCALIALGCVQTIVVRLRRTLRLLR